jgi:integrase
LVLPTLGPRPIDDIQRSEIIRCLDQVEDEQGPVQADRTLAAISRIMNWHASRSDSFRSPIVRGMARTKPKERARDRVLTHDELRAVWKQAKANGVFGAMIRSILLTAARRSEASELRWTRLRVRIGLCQRRGTRPRSILSGPCRRQRWRYCLQGKGSLYSAPMARRR